MLFKHPDDVIDWLRERTGNRCPYALLRGSGPFSHPDSQFFKACLELSEKVRDNVPFVSQLIRSHNWRHYVIGNAIAVINHDSRFEQDYVDKLTTDSGMFMGPLAAGWLIISTGSTIPAVGAILSGISERIITEPNKIPIGKVLAVCTALQLANYSEAFEFEKTALYQQLITTDGYYHTVETTRYSYATYLHFHNSFRKMDVIDS